MAIRVRCSVCGHVFRVADKYEGRKGRCPKCGDVTRIVNSDRLPPDASTAPVDGASQLMADEPTKLQRSDSTERRRMVPRAEPLPEAPELAGDAAAPLFEASSPSNDAVAAPAFPNIAVDAPKRGAHAGQSKSQGGSKPILLWAALGGVGLLLVLAAVGVGLYSVFSSGGETGADESVAQGADGAPESPNQQNNGDRASAGTTNHQPQDDSASDPTGDNAATTVGASDRVAQSARRFTVKLRVARPQGSTTCTGFYVDGEGWIATSWDCLRGATGVSVQFEGESETSLAAAGIVVEDRRSGLVLISARPSRPFQVAPLVASLEVARGDPLYACAMPAWGDDWLSECTFNRTCATGALPPAVLEQARTVVGDGAGTSWIETEGVFSKDGAGGPLLDDAGKVVGICLFADGGGRSYAVEAEQLQTLLDTMRASSSHSLQPFAPDGRMPAIALAPPEFNPGSIPVEAPTPGVSPASALADKLAELGRQCETHQWLPKTPEQYEVFQQFALEAVRAAMIADDETISAEDRRVVQTALNKALSAELVWQDAAPRARVNQLASQAIEPVRNSTSPQGFYAFGEVTNPPDSLVGEGGRPMVGMDLTGSREVVFMTINAGTEELRRGTRWLIIGARVSPIHQVESGEGAAEGPPASFVVVKHLLGEPNSAASSEPRALP